MVFKGVLNFWQRANGDKEDSGGGVNCLGAQAWSALALRPCSECRQQRSSAAASGKYRYIMASRSPPLHFRISRFPVFPKGPNREKNPALCKIHTLLGPLEDAFVPIK